MKNKTTKKAHGFRWYVSDDKLHKLSGPVTISSAQVKRNIEKSNLHGVVLCEDGHAEVRWPERPGWSYYDSLDAALIAAELRGYHVKR